MISGGEVSGKNFLMKETFEYAKERVVNKRENETIDGVRSRNRCSLIPVCSARTLRNY